MIQFVLNQELVSTEVAPGTVLLDLLRRERMLTGTKEGCREGDCGACSVLVGDLVGRHVQYHSAASCLLPIGSVHGKHVVTIEGLTGNDLSPIQQVIVDEGATQCGFCTPGIITALTGYLLNGKSFSLEDVLAAIEGNICRCTGYISIRRAAQRLLSLVDNLPGDQEARIASLVTARILPDYFLTIGSCLEAIEPYDPVEPVGTPPVLVAGGTDLFVQQADRLQQSPLCFLNQDPDLRFIRLENDTIMIGGATTMEELKNDERLCSAIPGWSRALSLISSTLIRNKATVGGNIVNASPIGDLTIILLALNGILRIKGLDGSKRSVPLAAFYHGYKQFDLHPGEQVTEISFSLPSPETRFNFEKVARRAHLDIASVNSAMLLEEASGRITRARIAAGGVAPFPLFLARSSAWLTGRKISKETVDALTGMVEEEIAPIDDVRGSAHYKRRLLRRLIIAHFVECFPGLGLEELVL